MTSTDRASWRVVPLLVVLALLLFLGLRPAPVPVAFAGEDKVHHAVGFAALVVTLRIAFPRRHILGVMAFALALSLFIELGQRVQPHRSPSASDMVANAIGVVVGAAASLLGRAWMQARERSSIER